MITYSGPRIIEERNVDDGTTGGKTVFIDEDGTWWEPTNKTNETCGTGDRIGILRNGRVFL